MSDGLNTPSTPLIWKDGRYFPSYFLPLGMLSWALGVVYAIYGLLQPFISDLPEESREASIARVGLLKVVTVEVIAVVCIIGALYFIVGGLQIYFLELRERFIAHQAHYLDGEFELKGYYFKSARFRTEDVAEVLKVVQNNKMSPFAHAGWRYGTLLTRNPRARHNYSLKVTLNDGKAYFFPGEMIEKEGPESLLSALLTCPLPRRPAEYQAEAAQCATCGGALSCTETHKFSRMDIFGLTIISVFPIWLLGLSFWPEPGPRGKLLYLYIVGLVVFVLYRMFKAREIICVCRQCGRKAM